MHSYNRIEKFGSNLLVSYIQYSQRQSKFQITQRKTHALFVGDGFSIDKATTKQRQSNDKATTKQRQSNNPFASGISSPALFNVYIVLMKTIESKPVMRLLKN
jgi:hypothetical protein